MAVQVLSDFSGALSVIYQNKLVSQINKNSVLLNLLPVVPGKGQALYGTAEFSGAADAVAYAEGAARTAANADAEVEVPYTLAWAQYDKTASVSGLAKAAAASNYNPFSVTMDAGQDLLLSRVQAQAKRLALGIATALYDGDPTASPMELAGAETAVDSSGTFAGINQATYSEWASVAATGALASVTLASVREDLITPIYDACGETPEFLTCPSNLFDILKGQLGAYESNSRVEFELNRGGGVDGQSPVVKIEYGTHCFTIDGIPVVRDRHCTANTIYGWNTNFIELQQLLPASSIFNAPNQVEMLKQMADSMDVRLPKKFWEGMDAQNSGIRPVIDVLGKAGDSDEVNVKFYGQVDYKRRNAFGKLTLS